jgi:hypothetical protein
MRQLFISFLYSRRNALKTIVFLGVLLIVVLTACSYSEAPPAFDKTWISPGKVEINNYYAGYPAKGKITLHNGNVKAFVETRTVTTGGEETISSVPLKTELYGDLNEIKISSSISEDLVAEKYLPANRCLYIRGFKPDAVRQLTLAYPRYTGYSLYCRAPDKPAEGYAGITDTGWIAFSDPSPVMAPGETRDITVSLNTPVDSDLPDDRWEFWIGVKESGNTSSISIELCSRWRVNMKGN